MTTRVLKERTRVTTHLYNLPMLMGMRMIRMNGERFIYPPMPFMTHQTTNHRAPTILTTASWNFRSRVARSPAAVPRKVQRILQATTMDLRLCQSLQGKLRMMSGTCGWMRRWMFQQWRRKSHGGLQFYLSKTTCTQICNQSSIICYGFSIDARYGEA